MNSWLFNEPTWATSFSAVFELTCCMKRLTGKRMQMTAPIVDPTIPRTSSMSDKYQLVWPLLRFLLKFSSTDIYVAFIKASGMFKAVLVYSER